MSRTHHARGILGRQPVAEVGWGGRHGGADGVGGGGETRGRQGLAHKTQ
jgi:hypothetical protein